MTTKKNQRRKIKKQTLKRKKSSCKHSPKSKISDAVVSKKTLSNGVVEVIVKKVLTDDQVAKCEADYFSENDYALIVDFDCDCYYYNNKKR